MKKSIVRLGAPAFAAICALSAAFAAGARDERAPHALAAADVAHHADRTFARADLDGDGALSVEEYAALTLVTSELARLNRAAPVETAAGFTTLALPEDAPAFVSPQERTRLDAIARREFLLAAEGAAHLTEDGFRALELERFLRADRDRNGVLARGELDAYARAAARLPARKTS